MESNTARRNRGDGAKSTSSKVSRSGAARKFRGLTCANCRARKVGVRTSMPRVEDLSYLWPHTDRYRLIDSLRRRAAYMQDMRSIPRRMSIRQDPSGLPGDRAGQTTTRSREGARRYSPRKQDLIIACLGMLPGLGFLQSSARARADSVWSNNERSDFLFAER